MGLANVFAYNRNIFLRCFGKTDKECVPCTNYGNIWTTLENTSRCCTKNLSYIDMFNVSAITNASACPEIPDNEDRIQFDWIAPTLISVGILTAAVIGARCIWKYLNRRNVSAEQLEESHELAERTTGVPISPVLARQAAVLLNLGRGSEIINLLGNNDYDMPYETGQSGLSLIVANRMYDLVIDDDNEIVTDLPSRPGSRLDNNTGDAQFSYATMKNSVEPKGKFMPEKPDFISIGDEDEDDEDEDDKLAFELLRGWAKGHVKFEKIKRSNTPVVAWKAQGNF